MFHFTSVRFVWAFTMAHLQLATVNIHTDCPFTFYLLHKSQQLPVDLHPLAS